MYVYSTLALEKEREIETALRKEKEAVCCYAVQGCIQSCTCTCTCICVPLYKLASTSTPLDRVNPNVFKDSSKPRVLDIARAVIV